MTKRCIGRWAVASVLVVVCAELTSGGELFAQSATDESQAQQPARSQEATASAEGNQRIAELIKKLDSDDFRTRQRASRELDKLGGQVIPEVTQALESASAEVQSRCLLLLTRCWDSKDEATHKAAERALKELQDSANPIVAQFAKRLLNPSQPNNPLNPRRGGFGRVGGVNRIGGRVVKSFTRRQANGQVVKGQLSTDNNGVKSIHVEEDGKTIDVKQNPQGAIKLKVTASVDGKSKVTHYAADSEDELKKKHPEGHKTYKHVESLFVQRPLEKPLNAKDMQQRIQQLRARARGRGFARPNQAGQVRSLQQAQQQIDAALKQMRELLKQTPISNQQLQKQIEQIEAARKTLDELRKQLAQPVQSIPIPFAPIPQNGKAAGGTQPD